jgi:hypothetical protein
MPALKPGERKIFVLWLLVNVLALTGGFANWGLMLFLGPVAALAQAAIFVWKFGQAWLFWLVLAPVIWFYTAYGMPWYGTGVIIGLCEYILFIKRFRRAYWWLPIHALTFSMAGLISAYYSNLNEVSFIRGFIAAVFYGTLTGIGLIWLMRSARMQTTLQRTSKTLAS